MKLIQKIGFGKIVITEKHIKDIFYIETTDINENKFYIWSESGFSSYDFKFFDDIESAIRYLKKVIIKPYFENRGEDNPKGF